MALRVARALLDLLFPPRCVVCGAAGADLCAACLGKIRRPPEPRCSRCDAPLADGRRARAGMCGECAIGVFAPDADRALVGAVYEGAVRAAIHALKYQGKRRAAEPLAGLALAAWRASGLDADVIVPVPLHRSRTRERGYDQAGLLARSLARGAGLPLRGDALARTRATLAQARLPASERQRNVAGAFSLLPGAAGLSGRTILLVDDVVTTGATIQAAASALREARPAAIYALAVARPLA
ncbi:MAG TPA: ComF family protein [Ktedonobacterales bacterium]|nr:ComF family protein [Ktedonobacterales bacterium]